MDDPNITMEEYISFEEEKSCRRVFNDTLMPEVALSCEPTVSSLINNEIDFRISFDESDDEDYTVIFDKKSFSYKIISVNDLKMDLENAIDKVNMPLFPSPEPTASYFYGLDYFKDFEKEFLVIVYNDALTSKLDFLTESTISPPHIIEFNLKDETSLSEYDEEEQNVLYFNDLFPFNIIYPDNLKSNKDNDDKPWGGYMSHLLVRAQRHPWLRYEVGGYTEEEMGVDIEARLSMRHRDAEGLVVFTSHAWRRLFVIRGPLVMELMLEFFSTCRFDDLVLDLDTDGVLSFQLGGTRRTMSWRQFILAMGLHTVKEIDTDGFRRYWAKSSRIVASKGDLRGYWEEISSSGDLLTTVPSYLLIKDPLRRLCHRLITHTIARRGKTPKKVTNTDLYFLRSMDQEAVNLPYLLAHYLFRHAKERKQGAQMSGGHFIA
ncbi:hypothetical protein Tco_1159057 [Tanacetum coccineum]